MLGWGGHRQPAWNPQEEPGLMGCPQYSHRRRTRGKGFVFGALRIGRGSRCRPHALAPFLPQRLHGAPWGCRLRYGTVPGDGEDLELIPFCSFFPQNVPPPRQISSPRMLRALPALLDAAAPLGPAAPLCCHLCYLPAGGGDPTPPVCSADFVPPKKSLEPPPGASSRAWTGSSRPLQPLLGVGVRRRGGFGGCQGDVRGDPGDFGGGSRGI